ncbi:hypothetical protein O7599_30565 [Streptomyces sp. WMMC500]|uniref:hypothetical protein n=1 Tax=Streptomyces sp. WMMC500 TaxID=3015154 RepID=UPI00248ABEF3|nr:hypothetical protein [Streptomyces sp. WMMC500]WBB59850.1 hypothetical protein O7599_30565 [Streptomyces sp. WMMC500]
MAFSQRMAALTAVVAIPLGVAATSYALTDDPEEPTPPARVEMESGTPSPSGSTSPSPEVSPSDEVVSPPPVRDGPTSADPSGGGGNGDTDDGGDDTGDDSGGGNDDDDFDD